ncbi:6-phosphogluconolactonase [Microbacterium sediminicola]|uniref:6-phosphogluconolactonase n=1 Tax=Microbacterium sediminicola TaxID=415210 RepID=A0ABN2HVK2_9MICO
MPEITNAKRVHVSATPADLTDYVSDRFLRRLEIESASRPIHISLTGGSMGIGTLAAAARNPRIAAVNWANVHFWWSDERFVERDSDERNEKQARDALLAQLDIPAENIHVPASTDDGIDLDAAAARYAAELARFAASPDQAWPHFDICFLGVGPDAHIASLFPDRSEITVTDATVLPVRNSPKPPPERVTFTRPVINSSERIWLVMAGTDKAAALGLALAGANYASVPAAGAHGTRRTVFFVDEAAAAQVPAELIDPEY